MIKLRRIVLVNWYLFDNIDLAIKGDVVLLKGANGSGKSSLLDAIQTVLAGADKTKLSYNAQSDASKSESRTLEAYALGVKAGNDDRMLFDRTESNTWIALVWEKPSGAMITTGVYVHAKAGSSDTKRAPFIAHAGLQASDFLVKENQAKTWKLFKDEATIPVDVFAMASEYRDVFAEQLSGKGRRDKFDPLAILRLLKRTLSFKHEQNLYDFIHSYVLPERNIDLKTLRNDHQLFKDIEQRIAHTKEKSDDVAAILTKLKKALKQTRIIEALKWAKYEGIVTQGELKIEGIEAKIERLDESIDEAEQADADYKVRISEAREEQASLIRAGAGNAANELQRLDNELRRLHSDKDQAKQQLIRPVTVLDALLETGDTERLFSVVNPYRASLAQSPSSAGLEQLIDALTTCLSESHATQHGLLEKQTKLRTEAGQLTQSHQALSAGRIERSKEVQNFIAICEQQGIRAMPLPDALNDDLHSTTQLETALYDLRDVVVVPSGQVVAAQSLLAEKNLLGVRLLLPSSGDGATETPYMKSGFDEYNGVIAGVVAATREDAETPSLHCIYERVIASKPSVEIVGLEARKKRAEALADQLKLVKAELRELERDTEKVTEQIHHLQVAITQLGLIDISAIEATLAELDTAIDATSEKRSVLEGSSEAQEDRYQKITQALDSLEAEKENGVGDLARMRNELKNASENLERSQVQLESAITERSALEANDAYDAAEYEALLTHEKVDPGETDLTTIERRMHERQEKFEKIRSGIIESVSYFSKTYDYTLNSNLQSGPLTELNTEMVSIHTKLVETDLARFSTQAREAANSMLTHFKTKVVQQLSENFADLRTHLSALNAQLNKLVFNGNTYSFHHARKEDVQTKQLLDYVERASNVGEHDYGGMFDDTTKEDDEALAIIQAVIEDESLAHLGDYRQYYTYDLRYRNLERETKMSVSRTRGVASVGERQTPLYVVLGAALMNTYKIRTSATGEPRGGIGISLFDEAFEGVDAANSSASLAFFASIGLQCLIAAPSDSETKIGGYCDQIVSIIRSGDTIEVLSKEPTHRTRDLLESDNPLIHSELIDAFLEEGEAVNA